MIEVVTTDSKLIHEELPRIYSARFNWWRTKGFVSDHGEKRIEQWNCHRSRLRMKGAVKDLGKAFCYNKEIPTEVIDCTRPKLRKTSDAFDVPSA